MYHAVILNLGDSMKTILTVMAALLLAACGGADTSGSNQGAAKKAQQTVTEQESDFKPVAYLDPKSEEVCKNNGGFKGCYGFAFECNDGLKTKIEQVSCIQGKYTEETPGLDNADQKQEAQVNNDDPAVYCKSISKLAESIMSARQNGVPMSDAMEISSDTLVRALVEDAYKKPALNTPEYQQKYIRDFADSAYSICWKTMNK